MGCIFNLVLFEELILFWELRQKAYKIIKSPINRCSNIKALKNFQIFNIKDQGVFNINLAFKVLSILILNYRLCTLVKGNPILIDHFNSIIFFILSIVLLFFFLVFFSKCIQNIILLLQLNQFFTKFLYIILLFLTRILLCKILLQRIHFLKYTFEFFLLLIKIEIHLFWSLKSIQQILYFEVLFLNILLQFFNKHFCFLNTILLLMTYLLMIQCLFIDIHWLFFSSFLNDIHFFNF